MALSIGVSVDDSISVGEGLIRVKQFVDPDMILIEVIDQNTTKEWLISEKERKEIMPNVFVFVGQGERGGTNRLAFEAPRRIAINRVPKGMDRYEART